MKKNLVLNYKVIGVLVAAVLLLSCAIGGTMAWLATKTKEVQNIFTTSDIDIELKETKTDFKMVPGMAIDKDPKVTVEADSEDCFLFVKIEKSSNFDTYLKFEMESGWTKLTEETSADVYFRKVTKSPTAQTFSILGAGTYGDFSWTADHVFVLPGVTKAEMTTAKTNQPTLTFTAYAVQLYKTNGTEFTAVDAWAQAKNLA